MSESHLQGRISNVYLLRIGMLAGISPAPGIHPLVKESFRNYMVTGYCVGFRATKPKCTKYTIFDVLEVKA